MLRVSSDNNNQTERTTAMMSYAVIFDPRSQEKTLMVYDRANTEDDWSEFIKYLKPKAAVVACGLMDNVTIYASKMKSAIS